MKAKQTAKEANNAESGGAGNTDNGKVSMDEHAHTMLVNAFKNFNTGSEEHLFFSQMVEKFRYIPNSWLLLNIKSSIEIISNKAMVTNIQRSPNPIILHFNEVLEHLEYTANINDYRRELYEPKAIEKNTLPLPCHLEVPSRI